MLSIAITILFIILWMNASEKKNKCNCSTPLWLHNKIDSHWMSMMFLTVAWITMIICCSLLYKPSPAENSYAKQETHFILNSATIDVYTINGTKYISFPDWTEDRVITVTSDKVSIIDSGEPKIIKQSNYPFDRKFCSIFAGTIFTTIGDLIYKPDITYIIYMHKSQINNLNSEPSETEIQY